MTALNAFLDPGGAHLLTDGAMYDADARVLHIGSKVAVCEPLRLAIAVSGMAQAGDVVQCYGFQPELTQRGALNMLPAIAVALADANRAIGAPGEADVQLVAAAWSDEDDEPQLWVGSSNQAWFGERYAPGTLMRLGGCSGSNINPLSVVPVDRAADGFDAVLDGLELLRAQRRQPWPDDGHFYVGGFAERTSVTREGVSKVILERWADEVGHPIHPGA